MTRKDKPLIFRGDVARRNSVRYMVHYTHGADKPFYVSICDQINGLYVKTDRTRRFATPEEARAFLQDVYTGEVKLDVLQDEVDAVDGVEQSRYDAMIDAEVEQFKKTLNLHGIFLDDYLAALAAWNRLHEGAKAALYRETKEGSK